MKTMFWALTGFWVAVSIASADEGFFLPERLPEDLRPAQYARILKASPKIKLDIAWCSGSFISNDGYYLTAGHCFYKMFMTAPKALFSVEGDDHKGPFQIVTTLKQRPGFDVDVIEVPELGLEGAKAVFVGKSISVMDEDRAEGFSPDQRARLSESGSDFVILKFDTRGRKVACLPRALAEPKVGERIWMAGYPAATTRPNGHASDGRSKFVSYGEVYADISSNSFFKTQRNYPEGVWDFLRAYYDRPDNLISNMDGYSGQSGSSVVNARGELVGVFVADATPWAADSEHNYYDGIAIAKRVSGVIREMRDTFPKGAKTTAEQELATIFNCKP